MNIDERFRRHQPGTGRSSHEECNSCNNRPVGWVVEYGYYLPYGLTGFFFLSFFLLRMMTRAAACLISVTWRGVAWRGVAWRGVVAPGSQASRQHGNGTVIKLL